MAGKKVDHTIIRGNLFVCLNCGGEFSFDFPIALDEFAKKGNAFNVLHEKCVGKPKIL